MLTRASKCPLAAERRENAAQKSRVKKSIEKVQQEEAFKEFLVLLGANGGNAPYGAVDKLVKAYHKNGFKGVTRQNLSYCLEQPKQSSMTVKIITATASSSGTI